MLGARPYLLSLWAALYLLPPADVGTRRILLVLLGLYAGARWLRARSRYTVTGVPFRGIVFQKRHDLLWEVVMALSVIGVLLAAYLPVVIILCSLMLIIICHQEADMWTTLRAEGWME